MNGSLMNKYLFWYFKHWGIAGGIYWKFIIWKFEKCAPLSVVVYEVVLFLSSFQSKGRLNSWNDKILSEKVQYYNVFKNCRVTKSNKINVRIWKQITNSFNQESFECW